MKTINHELTDLPVCPHCGEEDQDWWDGLGDKRDGDSWDMDCPFCGKAEAERQEALLPDKQKLLDYTDKLVDIPLPKDYLSSIGVNIEKEKQKE